MKHRATGPCTNVFALFLAFNGSACSLIFVKPPPSSTGKIVGSSRKQCTSSKLAPVLDTLFTGLEVVRTAYAIGADDSVYASPDQPLSREADVALGVGFTALFLGSAIYGYSATARCARSDRSDDDDDHAENQNEAWYDGDGRQATPARARPAPPRAAPVANTPSPAGVAAPTAQPPAPAAASAASVPSAPPPATEAAPAPEPSPAP